MRLAVLLAAVLVLTVPATPLAASTATQTAFDSTVTIDVNMQSDGDARLVVWTAYPLNTSADEEAFDRLATDFSEGRTGFQIGVFEAAASEAAERTGREMTIQDVNRVAEVRNESGNATGVLSLEFTWTNFARKSGDLLVLDSGWLTHLEDDMRLRVDPPTGYSPQDVPVAFVDGRAVWEGPYTFEDGGGPDLVFESGITSTTATTTTTTDPGPGGDGPLNGEFQMVLAGVAVLLVGGLLAYVWTRREVELPDDSPTGGPGGPGGSDDGADGTAAGAADSAGPSADSASTDEPAGGADEPTADSDSGPADAGDGAAAGSAAADDADDESTGDDEPEIDEELLSDEERVERMLRENGGRMKQANIVTETGWSNAKVSQLLSGMDEADRIDKLRLGRENLIILGGRDEDDEFGA